MQHCRLHTTHPQDLRLRGSGGPQLVSRRATRALTAAVLGAEHPTSFLLGSNSGSSVGRDMTRRGVLLVVDNLGLDRRRVDAEAVHHATDLNGHLDKVSLVGHDVHRGDALGFGEGPNVELCGSDAGQR